MVSMCEWGSVSYIFPWAGYDLATLNTAVRLKKRHDIGESNVCTYPKSLLHAEFTTRGGEPLGMRNPTEYQRIPCPPPQCFFIPARPNVSPFAKKTIIISQENTVIKKLKN